MPTTKSVFTFRVLTLSACLALLTLSATSLSGALITFHVRGHMIWSSGPDLNVGDAFSAFYTFESSAPPTGTTSEDVDAHYLAIRNWRFTFASGYAFAAADSYAGDIILANNNSGFPGGYDRYLATLFNVQAIGAPLPSGRHVQYIQFYFDDYEPVGNPDLLSDHSLPTTPPSIQLSDYATGRLVLNEALDDFGQPNFNVDSISIVSEPDTAANFGALTLALLLSPWGTLRRLI